jgi:hypothetical protein
VNPVDGLRDLLFRRGWRGWLILGFVTIQLVAPLHYYLFRDDKHDERFAWRMFSPMRMMTCDAPPGHPMFTLDGAEVPLYKTFHEAWIEVAKRGRIVVLEAMAAKLCADHPGSDVRLDLVCVDLSNRPESVGGGFDLCKFPEL